METTSPKSVRGIKIALLSVVAGICVVSAGWVLAQTSVMEVKEDLKIDTDTLYVDSANNRVGIGTSSPAEALHVDGSVRGNQSGALRISTGNGYMDVGPKNSSWAHFHTDRAKFYFQREIQVASGRIGSYQGNLSLCTDGTTRVTIERYGNNHVGIGTTSPSSYGDAADNLVIYETGGGCGLTIASDSDTTGSIFFADGTGGNDYRKASIAYDHSAEKLYFRTTPSGGSPGNRIVITDDGYIGISVGSPTEKLDVNGAIRLRAMANPPLGTGEATFYARDISDVERMCVRDESGNDTVLSSHRDPREVNPQAASSFADGTVSLPFSFSHSNAFIRKGAVVDMAALVAKVEQLTGETFTHEYTLSAEEILSVTEWQRQCQAQLEKEAKDDILQQEPEVEISISEAWEEVEIQEEIETVRSDVRWAYNLETEEVFTLLVEESVTELVVTGQYERRLRAGVRFDDKTGKFYRRRTLEEIEIDPIAPPELPEWVVMRLP